MYLVLKVSGDNDSELSLDQISELETKLADHEWNEEIVQQALTVFAKTPKVWNSFCSYSIIIFSLVG